MAALPQGESWKEAHEEDVSEIAECYCPNCGGTNATTVMLPTKVPLFREIIIMSLRCDDCAFRDSEVNFGGEIQERGERIALTVAAAGDLNRQLIKSDSASLLIPSLEFEIPPTTQRGSVSTIEGVLRRAADNLEAGQPERLRLGDVDNFHRCRDVIRRLRAMVGDAGGESDDEEDGDDEDKGGGDRPFEPFDIVLDDPAGNSFVENPLAPDPDPQMRRERYVRTPRQDMALGLQPSEDAVRDGSIDDADPAHKNVANAPGGRHAVEIDPGRAGAGAGAGAAAAANGEGEAGVSLGKKEVLKFPTDCPHCHKSAETDMCVTDIPHFKEVIIMSLLCEHCGYKSNEIKGGGAIPKFGTKVTLRVGSADDLAREVLKSDTAGVAIPELDLHLSEGGLDGLYTTVEGLLNKMHDRLAQANPFQAGDSATKQHRTNDGGDFSGLSPNHARYAEFLRKLKDMADGKTLPFTLIVSDPLSNSFVGPVPEDAVALALRAEREGSHECYDRYVDPGMTIEEYERTHDQNETLGLNDMKTENYLGGGKDRSGDGAYYGTDQMEELPDRLRRLDHRGPDHPLVVGKAPVESDTTVMGPKSANFAIPGMAQRGKRGPAPRHSEWAKTAACEHIDRVPEIIAKYEHDDENFMMNDKFDGPKEGMVYKYGKQGLGYYTDVPLSEMLAEVLVDAEKDS